MADPTASLLLLAEAAKTGGAAAKPAATGDTAAGGAGGTGGALSQLVDLGGPIVLILIGLSVIALCIILLKLYQFARARILARGFIEKALDDWDSGRPQAALERLHRSPSPIARVMETAMAGGLRPGLTEETIREECARVATDELKRLGAWLRALEVIAAAAPLLGLLGTVVGMIIAFQDLQATGSRADPGVLAGGIWQALLTTAVGLSIAVPVSVALSFLESAVDRAHHAMEDALTRIFTTPLRLTEPVEEAGTGAAPELGVPAMDPRAAQPGQA